jgi:hypothetical protein
MRTLIHFYVGVIAIMLITNQVMVACEDNGRQVTVRFA